MSSIDFRNNFTYVSVIIEITIESNRRVIGQYNTIIYN